MSIGRSGRSPYFDRHFGQRALAERDPDQPLIESLQAQHPGVPSLPDASHTGRRHGAPRGNGHQPLLTPANARRQRHAQVQADPALPMARARDASVSIMAQVVYYFSAIQQVVANGEAIDRGVSFSVPTGNFGNVLSGWIAKRMGAPIRHLVVGSNSNDILTRFAPTIPIFGVCLGHQCLAVAHGATVARAPSPVHGKGSAIHHRENGLFSGLSQGFLAARYHSLAVVEATLPPELEVTARTDDGVVMGLRHRARPQVGVQFHPESVLTPDGAGLIRNFLALRRPAPAVAARRERPARGR